MLNKKILLVGPYFNNKASGLTRFITNLENTNLENCKFLIFDDSASFGRQRNFFLILKKFFLLAINLKRNRYDFVQFHCNSIGFSFVYKYLQLLIAKLTENKIIVRYGGSSGKDFFGNKSFFSFLFKSFFSFHSVLICQSMLMKSFFNSFIDESKIFILPNFSDSSKKSSSERKILRRKRVLFFGGGNISGDDYRKGSYDVLNLISGNDSLLSKFDFICLNPSDNFRRKCSESSLHNRIIMKKRMNYEPALHLYSLIDILLLPSYREGLPNSIIECMSQGCAIISSNVGSITDVISEGVNGYLIDPGDIEAINSKLRLLENDKTLNLIKKKNLEHWSKKYSIEAVKPVLEQIYALS